MLSVVIPIYNQENYLKQCLTSVQNQTLTDFEVILVNDGSTDNSLRICNEFVSKDKRFKVFTIENGGQSKARNFGMQYVTKPYLTFIDSDDWVDDDTLEVLYTTITTNNADIACCGYYIDVEKTAESIKVSNDQTIEYWDTKQALSKLIINKEIKDFPCAKIYKTVIFKGIQFHEGVFFEDIRLMYKIFDKAAKVIKVSKSKYHYRQHSSNTTADATKSVKKELDFYFSLVELHDFIKNNPEKVNEYQKVKAELERRIYRCRKISICRFSVFSDDFKQISTKTIHHYRSMVEKINVQHFGFFRYLGVLIILYAPVLMSFSLWLRGRKKRI